jgi:hypothetical protein
MAKKVARPARNSVKKLLSLRSLGCRHCQLSVVRWVDGGTNVTRALEAEVLAHEGARNGAVDVVGPFGHGGQKFVCDQRPRRRVTGGRRVSREEN